MTRNILHEVAELVSPLKPFQAGDDRIVKEEEWIERLTEADILLLLDWLHQPTPIMAPIPVEAAHLPEVADRVAYYVGTAGKRIGSQAVREGLEELLHDPSMRMSALEGLDAFGDRQSVTAIRTVSKDSDPSFVRQAAFVLGSLGGSEAIQVLQEMLREWLREAVVGKTIIGAIEEADK